MQDLGKVLIGVGLLVVAVGALLWLGGFLPEGIRPGRLPGDIRIERDRFTFYFPLTTMILLSLLLSALLWLLR